MTVRRSKSRGVSRSRPPCSTSTLPGGRYQLLAALRAERPAIRILLLASRQQEDEILRGVTLGADDYIVKPFSPMELVARLKRLIGK